MLAFLFTKIEKKPAAAAAEPEAAEPEAAAAAAEPEAAEPEAAAAEPEAAVAIAPGRTPPIHINRPELDLGLANLDPVQKPQENQLLTFLYLASMTKPELPSPYLPPESQLDNARSFFVYQDRKKTSSTRTRSSSSSSRGPLPDKKT